MANLLGLSTPVLVMSRTPLRISFAGGGTDLAAFYEHDYGAVLSTAINKYIYVTVKRHGDVFNERIRLNYSKSEHVQDIEAIENNIARVCLRFMKIEPPIYISTVGDLPASTGLGGSSSFAVGLLNALYAYRGERVSAGQLAEEAAYIEIELLSQPIGKQDQYAAAFGGMNLFCFRRGGAVTVEPQRLANGNLAELFRNLAAFWTGHQRDASGVLQEQKSKTVHKLDSLLKMRTYAHDLHVLLNNEHLDVKELGRILHENWRLKKGLASTISSNQIDHWYEQAMNAGAFGGKICGAGGGGFLLFVVPPEHQDAVQNALKALKPVPLAAEVHGSQVLLVE